MNESTDALIAALRALEPQLLALGDHVRVGASFDADIVRDVEYARALITGLAHKLDSVNLACARARAMSRNGVAARLQVEHGGSVEPAPLLACSPSDANGRTEGRA